VSAPHAPKPPVAVVDLGSNTVKVLVVAGSLPLCELAKLTLDTRLGPNAGEPQNALSERALREGTAAVAQLVAFAKKHGAEKIRIVATSMVRDSTNGDAFCQRVRQETGAEIEVLDGDAEARGIAAGALTDPALADADALRIVDLGGGSLEYIVAVNAGQRGQHTLRLAESRPLGAVRLTRAFVRDAAAPIPAAELAAVERHVCEVMAPLVRADDPTLLGAPFAGCGGVFTVSRMLFAEELRIDVSDTPAFLPVEKLRRLRDSLAALPFEKRIHPPALPPVRTDIFPVALSVLLALADLANAPGFTQTYRSLRHGLAAELIAGE
jgi:exopolyphosphatase/guanosine-5'-triphosphate,3'-diphosphate pyrophosphatase